MRGRSPGRLPAGGAGAAEQAGERADRARLPAGQPVKDPPVVGAQRDAGQGLGQQLPPLGLGQERAAGRAVQRPARCRVVVGAAAAGRRPPAGRQRRVAGVVLVGVQVEAERGRVGVGERGQATVRGPPPRGGGGGGGGARGSSWGGGGGGGGGASVLGQVGWRPRAGS